MFLSLILIAVIIYFFWQRDQGLTVSGKTKDPMDLAKERYARGEISTEEFKEIKANLH